MKINQIKNELKYKERKIDDLVRYIKTRNDDNPNYTLFLGAGCSVSSGIRSASELIKQWRKEVYKSLQPTEKEKDYSDEKCVEYLSASQSGWYDKRNEYASLFEKRYDLPRQRRMFIEQEVAGKIPSLGYAYLVKLVRGLFFRTIFTTNFDDSLNEAFYLYSDERPLVCAHDSAISSITVTSKRPKIIKLHGDYLFDDIKSTLRETESLEENIKNKFIEFAKDYGLIIVGYGGNDRSILDVLFYLLKQEEYLKNGIYYCFRQDDEINEEVRKLLWKDRVYYVIIDGFDELMASFNRQLNKEELPVETSIISNKTNKLIDDLLSNAYLKESPSQIIKDDLRFLKEQKDERFLQELLKSLERNDEESGKREAYQRGKIRTGSRTEVLLNEQIIMIKLYEKMRMKRYDDVIRETNGLLAKGVSKQEFQKDLLTVMAKCQLRKGDRQDATKTYKNIVELDDNDVENKLTLAQLMDNPEDKLRLIDRVIEKTPYSYKPYYYKAKALKYIYDRRIDCNNTDAFNQILETLRIGTELNPALNNGCWQLTFNYMLRDQKDMEKAIRDAQNILDVLKKQNPFDMRVLSMEMDIHFTSKKNNHDDIFDKIKKAREKSIPENAINYEMLLLDAYARAGKTEEIKNQFCSIEEQYETDADYLENKATLMLTKLDDLEGSIQSLKQSVDLDYNQGTLRHLFKYYLYAEMYKEAEDILRNQLGRDNRMEEVLYLEAKKQYDEALGALRNIVREQPWMMSKNTISRESFFLLAMEKYEEAQRYLRKYLEINNFTEQVLVINYELAGKLLNKKVHKERLSKMYDHSENNLVKAAICVLNDENNKALDLIEKAIEGDYENKYDIKDWVIFKPLQDNPRLQAFYKKQIAEC
jgi:hypothetical protein